MSPGCDAHLGRRASHDHNLSLAFAAVDTLEPTAWAVPASLVVAALVVAGSSVAFFRRPKAVQQTASNPEGPIRVVELLVHPIKVRAYREERVLGTPGDSDGVAE